VYVIRPAEPTALPFAFSALVVGRPKFARFKTLNISALNVAFTVSLKLKLFSSDKSTSASPGPMTVFLPRVPYVPASGTVNAHGSNQCLGFPTRVPAGNPAHPAETPLVGLLLAPGFRLGRSALFKAPSL